MNTSSIGIKSAGIESGDLTPWSRLFPLNEATPVTCVHLGIEYCGEVVRTTCWSPARKQLSALGLLNTIVEIGSPQESILDDPLAALDMRPSPCSYRRSKIDLTTEPLCPEFRVILTQKVPTTELSRLAPQVELALGGKTQEVNRRLVEKTLAGQSIERWTEFLQVVQGSKLSSLANTLDNDLVTFIKQVLD